MNSSAKELARHPRLGKTKQRALTPKNLNREIASQTLLHSPRLVSVAATNKCGDLLGAGRKKSPKVPMGQKNGTLSGASFARILIEQLKNQHFIDLTKISVAIGDSFVIT